jgi:hypothetical protein
MGAREGGSVPLLITGITPATDDALVNSWSGGAILGCRRVEDLRHARYTIGDAVEITGQLTRNALPVVRKRAYYLIRREYSQAKALIDLRDEGRTVPLFVMASLKKQQVFLDATIAAATDTIAEARSDVLSAFTDP